MPTSVFLSYARADDGEPFNEATSFVARLYRDLTARGFDVWFDRVSMPSRNLTFHQEIRDAIAGRDRVVLVVGPQAAVSAYVEQEWQFAWYQAEKVVTPILRQGLASVERRLTATTQRRSHRSPPISYRWEQCLVATMANANVAALRHGSH